MSDDEAAPYEDVLDWPGIVGLVDFWIIDAPWMFLMQFGVMFGTMSRTWHLRLSFHRLVEFVIRSRKLRTGVRYHELQVWTLGDVLISALATKCGNSMLIMKLFCAH